MQIEKSERKENLNLNITQNQSFKQDQNVQLIALDVPPPREVPDDERILRDRKDKQLKVKEAVN